MKPHRIFSFGLSLSCLFAFETFSAELLVKPDESSIEVEVKATVDDFTAKLTQFDAKVQVAEGGNLPKAAVINWDFNDLKTGNKKRDKEMLHWLENAAGSKGYFTLTKCEEKEGHLLAIGDVSMHGVKKEVTFPLSAQRRAEHLEYSGVVELNYENFGLPKIVKFAVLKVDPLLTIHFKLAGTLASTTNLTNIVGK